MQTTRTMNAFSDTTETGKVSFNEMFPDEARKVRAIENTYTQAVTASKSQKEKTAARKMMQADAKQAADALLRKDKTMRLQFPFELTREIAAKIKSNPKYYLNDGIITNTHQKGRCLVCDKRFKSGDIFVICGNNKMICLGCTDDNITINGAESYIVQSL